MLNQFKTKKDAIEFLREIKALAEMTNGNFYPTGTYYLSHGEYSQPEFKTVRYADGWGIKRINFYYAGTFHAPIDGRLSQESFEAYFLTTDEHQ